jgi:hypothetical protein
LTETSLNGLFYNQNLFPGTYFVYRADSVSTVKSRGGGALIAISDNVSGVVRRADLELVEECVWVEIPTVDGISLIEQFLPTNAHRHVMSIVYFILLIAFPNTYFGVFTSPSSGGR